MTQWTEMLDIFFNDKKCKNWEQSEILWDMECFSLSFIMIRSSLSLDQTVVFWELFFSTAPSLCGTQAGAMTWLLLFFLEAAAAQITGKIELLRICLAES